MTNTAQNEAIAKACGFTGPFGFVWLREEGPEGEDVWAYCGTKDGVPQPVPNYTGSLDAMHEAETRSGKILGPAEWDAYVMQLRIKVGRDIEAQGGPGSVASLMNVESVVSATAAQRAEAFLRTLNLWHSAQASTQGGKTE